MPRATASSASQPLELEQETPWRQSRSRCWRDSLIRPCVTPFLLIQLYRKVSFRFLQMRRPRQIEKQRTINQWNIMQTLQDNYLTAYRSLKLTRDAKGVLIVQFHTGG